LNTLVSDAGPSLGNVLEPTIYLLLCTFCSLLKIEVNPRSNAVWGTGPYPLFPCLLLRSNAVWGRLRNLLAPLRFKRLCFNIHYTVTECLLKAACSH
jgi:hypothetical protein